MPHSEAGRVLSVDSERPTLDAEWGKASVNPRRSWRSDACKAKARAAPGGRPPGASSVRRVS